MSKQIKTVCNLLSGAALLLAANQALAAGELNIYNWGNYTSPELIEKFEKAHDVKVTITDYDSNDTALAKVKAGGHGFDIVVPSASHMPIFINEGLLEKTRPDQMENFKHMSSAFNNPNWDPGRLYSVPWQWGTVGMIVDTSVYDGDINTSSIFLDPPKELEGKINVAPEMLDVMATTIMYEGGEPCTTDKAILRKVRDTLVAAKPKWLSLDYGVIDKFGSKDLGASLYWNGAAFRAQEQNADVQFGYPREGYILWMDSVSVLADAKNKDNAKLFQNFIMDPQNAALISEFARYANGIDGSEQYMSKEMIESPIIAIPDEFASAGVFPPTCPPEAIKLYSKIWTDLLK